MSTAENTNNGPDVGIFDGIPNETYHRGPGISKSGLDDINVSPLHYITKRRHPKPPTADMWIGTAFHMLVLEPDIFERDYILLPADAPPRPTKRQLDAKNPSSAAMLSIAYWESWDAENSDKIPVSNKPGADPFWSPGEWDRLHYMRDAIASHPIASILLDPDQIKAEQSCIWVDPETRKLCKCRPDAINEAHNLAVDLKSTADASYTEFAKSCAKWRYHVQAAWYSDGLIEVNRPISAFIFVAVEKTPPWGVGIYVLNREARRAGRLEYRRNLETYAQCHRADEWPSYPPEIREIDLPRWGLSARIS